jgi:hypothetical protein
MRGCQSPTLLRMPVGTGGTQISPAPKGSAGPIQAIVTVMRAPPGRTTVKSVHGRANQRRFMPDGIRRHQACAGHPSGQPQEAQSSLGHFIGLDARQRLPGRYLFARYGGLIVFFGRFVALLRAFAALLAGANGLGSAAGGCRAGRPCRGRSRSIDR